VKDDEDYFASVMGNFERRWREVEIRLARSNGQRARHAKAAIRAKSARAQEITNLSFLAIGVPPLVINRIAPTLSTAALAKLQGIDIREDTPQ